jgi:hypothetical protein
MFILYPKFTQCRRQQAMAARAPFCHVCEGCDDGASKFN